MKDGDIYVNEHGGRQSYVSCRMDLIPPENLLLLGQCLGFGAKKYGENNWRQITEQENINHALVHLVKWLSGDRSEPHLVNTLARVNFALWHAIQSKEQGLEYVHPDQIKQNPEAETTEGLRFTDDYSIPEQAKRGEIIFCEEERRNAIYPPPTEYIDPGQTDKT